MKDIIEYIIKFLLTRENEHLVSEVSYGDNINKQVIIKKSNFFDDDIYMTEQSVPQLPLKECKGIPLLFGEPVIEYKENQVIVKADIIASTYFLITRYEECIKRDIRDEHGRFIGRESLPYRAGFIERPIVDEYGKLLRDCMRNIGLEVLEPKAEISHIYLTHDVDQIWTWDNYYRAFRTFIKRAIKNGKYETIPFKSVFSYKKYDPIYTFEEFIALDGEIKEIFGDRCTDIYFMMGCTTRSEYDVGYCSNVKKTAELIAYLNQHNATIGIHTSYKASQKMSQLGEEIKTLEKIGVHRISKVRNHYLASREPEDFRYYIENNLLDDFTMGYADIAGFRLGTCNAVKWIDPIKKELTDLVLHPMTVMECTLDDSRYMNISDMNIAFNKVKNLIDTIVNYNGEVTLLWHNTSISMRGDSYQRKLYIKILNYLKLIN